MANTYIAYQIKENNKYLANVLKVNRSDNLLIKLQIPNIICANVCSTKKEALRVADSWNQSSFDNGTYLYESKHVYTPTVID